MARDLTCCICDAPVAPPYHVVGQRVYCDRHYAALDKSHPGFWRAGLVQILGMAVFSLIVALIANQVGPLDGAWLIVFGVFLAIVPTALWLIYFYRQDRLEPEPKTKIALVFVAALLLTDFVGYRLVFAWFEVGRWAALDTVVSLLASVLISGFTLQAITYAAVRLVYATAEFDERMDGIVYGTVAGLGIATLMNLYYVITNEGVALAPGVINVVTNALAQASFGGVMGYIMAQARFEHKPIWWVPLGYFIVSVANGFFRWLIGEVSATGLTVDPWRSLALGLVVALGVFGTLVLLMRRTTDVTLARTTR